MSLLRIMLLFSSIVCRWNIILYTEKFLSETELNDEQFNDVRKQAREILKQYKKDLTDKYRGISTKQEIELFMKEKEQAVQDLMKSKKEEIKESKLLRQEND